MSKGKLSWVSDKFPALELDGSHYLTLADPDYLDFDVYHFALELMLMWDSSIGNPGTDKLVISKSAGALGAGEAGWEILMNPTNESLKVRFNDGNVGAILEQEYLGILPADTWHTLRLEFVRDGYLKLTKAGELEDATFDLSGRPNSLSNSEDLRVGHQDGGVNDYFQGWIGLIRFDGGPGWLLDAYGEGYFDGDRVVDYGEVWNRENYYKLQYGWPRVINHYVAAWYFANSLLDESAEEYELTWNGGGAASYGAGWPYLFTYQFEFNPVMAGGFDGGFLPLDNVQRAGGGTLRTYSLPMTGDKQRRGLVFRTNSREQWAAVQGAYLTKAPVHLYENADLPFLFRGYLPVPPQWREVFSTTTKTIWEITVEVEEI